MSGKWAAIIAAGIVSLLGTVEAAAASCQLVQLAELDATVQDNMPLVPVTIDGHPAQMILDTSSVHTKLSRSAAGDLHVKLRPSIISFHRTDGALDGAAMGTIHDFTFAGFTLHQFPLYVIRQALPTGNVLGVIGEDILSNFDIESDLGSGKVRFFNSKGCGDDRVAYWTREYFVADLGHTAVAGLLLADVMLDGKKLVAAYKAPRASRSTRPLWQPPPSPSARKPSMVRRLG